MTTKCRHNEITRTSREGYRWFCQDCGNYYKRKPTFRNVPAAKQSVENLANTQSGLDTVGYVVWWTVREILLGRNEFQTILADTLGENLMPPAPKGSKILRRTLKESLRDAEDAGFLRAIGANAFALVQEHVDKETVDIDFEKEGFVIWNGAEERLEFRGKAAENPEPYNQLFAKYSDAVVSSDIRNTMIKFVKANDGVTLSEFGGQYFLPDEESVGKLEDFLESVNNGSTVYVLPIVNGDKAKSTMLSRVKEELETEVELAAEEAKRMLSAKFVRGTTLNDRIERFKQLQEKCSTYADLLSLESGSMIKKLEDLGEEVQAALLGEYADLKEATDFPVGALVNYFGKADIGTVGQVVGYHKSKTDKAYIKVKFSDTGLIRPIAPLNLEIR